MDHKIVVTMQLLLIFHSLMVQQVLLFHRNYKLNLNDVIYVILVEQDNEIGHLEIQYFL